MINMVSSLDGKVTSTEGKAGAIGSPVDHRLMRCLRAEADAVMTGAGTIRAERLSLAIPEDLARARVSRGLKPQPLAVVTTASGDVPLEGNLIGASPDNLLVLLSSETTEERLAAVSSRASVEVVPNKRTKEDPQLDLSEALETLKNGYGVNVLLVEGGPALNHALIEGGLVDELFLTLAPKLLGGVGPETLTVLEGPPVPSTTELKIVAVHLSGDELFLRYTLRPA